MPRALPFLTALLLATTVAFAEGPLTQPAASSKSWEFRPLELPNLADVLKSAKPNPHIYGLYTWTGEYRNNLDSIRKVGWKSFRIGGNITDDDMKLLVEDDVEVMHTIAPGKEAGKPDLKNLDPYINFYTKKLAAFVDRYGPNGSFFKDNPSLPKRPITNLEICNEPNFQYLIPPDGRPAKELEADREALYAKLLPAAYDAIKAKSKDVRVIGFGAGGSGAGDMRFIEHVQADNPQVAKSYDVLSTHPYVEPAPPEAWAIRSWGGYSTANSLKAIRQIESKNGRADVPIWYTEVGWPISKADGGFFPSKGEMVSPMIQAACVCRLYAFAQRLGVQRVHIMFATDTDNFNGGFFLRDKSWRPSAHAVANMIKLLPAPKLIDVPSDGAEGLFVYRFQASEAGKTVVMAWNVTGPRKTEIAVKGGKPQVVDMLGNAIQATPKDGKLELEVGPYPVYINE
jgi:hypothetical protein